MFAVRRAPLRTGQGSGVVLQILHSVQDDRKHRSRGQKTPFRMTENTAQEDRKHRSGGQGDGFVQEEKMRAGGMRKGQTSDIEI